MPKQALFEKGFAGCCDNIPTTVAQAESYQLILSVSLREIFVCENLSLNFLKRRKTKMQKSKRNLAKIILAFMVIFALA
ncbi:MAG: hypothetical protein II356_05085, partial [Clostridia bacterium]|nr:hypothetical protein [Clostridia bacterium]